MLINKVIFISSLAFKLSIRVLLVSLISPMHRSIYMFSLRLGSGDFNVLSPLRGSVVCACVGRGDCIGLRTVGIHCACVRMRDHIRPIIHEFIHKGVPPALLRSLRTRLHIHRFILLVLVVDGTPFLPARLGVLHEIRAQRHQLRM